MINKQTKQKTTFYLQTSVMLLFNIMMIDDSKSFFSGK